MEYTYGNAVSSESFTMPPNHPTCGPICVTSNPIHPWLTITDPANGTRVLSVLNNYNQLIGNFNIELQFFFCNYAPNTRVEPRYVNVYLQTASVVNCNAMPRLTMMTQIPNLTYNLGSPALYLDLTYSDSEGCGTIEYSLINA